jgi:raffinose/stachyose/melibiose transport system substrate-binding protein
MLIKPNGGEMKRLHGALMVVMILLVAVAFSGCGRSDEESGKTVLTLWHIYDSGGPREVLDDAVARFEAANPGVKIVVQSFSNDTYKKKLAIEMQSGTQPDVFFTWGGGMLTAQAKAGKVYDLTDAIAKDGWSESFLPGPLGLCKSDGRTWAVPVDQACVPLWFNKELFDKHGVAPPKTFGELKGICKQFRAKGITPIALGNEASWPGAFYFIYMAARQGGTPLFIDANARKDGASFEDMAFVKAGEGVQELVKVKAFSTGFESKKVDNARSDFLNEKAAMYVMGTWLVGKVKKENAAFLDKMVCAAFPTVPGGKGDPTTVVGGVNCGFAISSTCKAPDKAIALLKTLTDKTVGEKWCKIGRIPALKVSDEALATLPKPTQSALQLLRKAKYMQPYYDQYLAPRLASEHKKTTQEIFALMLTPADAAARMEKLARELAAINSK